MLTQKDQKTIRSRLDNIYKIFLSKKDIDYFEKEIVQIIRQFNKKNPKKKKSVSEKTTLVICYGDSVYSEKKKSIRVFKNFFQKKLKNYFNTIHFLPFYPSSSDSGFAVKDHYKVENKLGNWFDIKNVSKSSNVMADMVINHSSARGLWFKNFLKKKDPGKDYFLTVNTKFNTSKVVRPRDHKLLKTQWLDVVENERLKEVNLGIQINPNITSNSGEINISISGGTPNYNYNWSGPNGYTNSTMNINNLAPGKYKLTVTDNVFANCIVQNSYTVLGSDPLDLAPTAGNAPNAVTGVSTNTAVDKKETLNTRCSERLYT